MQVSGVTASVKPALSLHRVPYKFTGGQNKFSCPRTPFETGDRNVIVCPANIRGNAVCLHHSINIQLFSLLTKNNFFFDNCDLTDITPTNHTFRDRMFSTWLVRQLPGYRAVPVDMHPPPPPPGCLYRRNLSSVCNSNISRCLCNKYLQIQYSDSLSLQKVLYSPLLEIKRVVWT
jgi:hypothetical protein